MTKVHRKVEYALMAFKHMASKPKGELTTAKEISVLYGCSFAAMSRVLQNLAQARILKSEQGVSGGYMIFRDLGELTFFDLIVLLVGPLEIAKCLQSPVAQCAIRQQCNIYSPIHTLNRRMEDFYRQLKVADLLWSANEPARSARNMEIA